MSEHIGTYGKLDVTKACAKCDSCGRFVMVIQLTGPNGYVTVCENCVAAFDQAMDNMINNVE